MERFGIRTVRTWIARTLALGVIAGASHAGAAPNDSPRASVGTAASGKGMLFSYKGKQVVVRLLAVKDKDFVGKCIDEDGISIFVQINNNVYQFFFSEIEYIESL